MEEAKKWYCTDRKCGGVIGHIIAGELHLADTVDPSSVRTQGNSLILECPNCGEQKVWFSSSPLVRSLEQFLDTMSYIVSKRAVNTVHKELTTLIDETVEKKLKE
ncbi:MAG TPA: hypothetical protein ENG48_11070 [Candidatus Atribacteria bacterium]|nr:hypothetical protein [Candidatus Atribacteria bacterium]